MRDHFLNQKSNDSAETADFDMKNLSLAIDDLTKSQVVKLSNSNELLSAGSLNIREDKFLDLE